MSFTTLLTFIKKRIPSAGILGFHVEELDEELDGFPMIFRKFPEVLDQCSFLFAKTDIAVAIVTQAKKIVHRAVEDLAKLQTSINLRKGISVFPLRKSLSG